MLAYLQYFRSLKFWVPLDSTAFLLAKLFTLSLAGTFTESIALADWDNVTVSTAIAALGSLLFPSS